MLALANAGFLDESSAASQKAFPGGYVETLYVDAESGIPVGFTGGVPGQEPSVTMTYDIERTTPARVRNGWRPGVADVSPPRPRNPAGSANTAWTSRRYPGELQIGKRRRRKRL